MLTAVTLTVSARAGEDIIKVGLYYGDKALYSANLQNDVGSGYALGWFDENTRQFQEIGYLEDEKISMTAGGTIYISGGAYSASRPGKVDGVIGSRMTGAGFGGCTVSIVKDEAIDTFIEKVGSAYKEKIGYAADFYVVEVGDGPVTL